MKISKVVFINIFLIVMLAVGAFAQDTVTTVKSEMNAEGAPLVLTTGGTGGVYYGKAAPQIESQLSGSLGDITILTSKGSVENIERLQSGEANAAIVQFDALIAEDFTEMKVVGELYSEYVHLITRRKDKGKGWKDIYKSIKDMDRKKHTIAIGPLGSGSSASWKAFTKLDKRYADFTTIPESGAAALVALETMQCDAVFFVSGKGGANVERANNKAVFRMTAFDDWDFNDKMWQGRKIYNFTELTQDKGAYSELFPGWYDDVETIAIEAIFVVSKEWYDNNKEQLGKLYDAVAASSKVLKKEMGQE